MAKSVSNRRKRFDVRGIAILLVVVSVSCLLMDLVAGHIYNSIVQAKAVMNDGGNADGGINVDRNIAGGTATKTYYVDNVRGSDSNGGTSPTQAWKSLAKVMNTLTGDQSDVTVLFKRGETWNGELDLPGSGSPGHPFTLGAYGTGKNPVIKAGKRHAHGIAAYRANHDVVIDSIDIYGGYDTGMIFQDSNVHDITIQNLTVSHSRMSGILVGANNVTIKNVTVHDNGLNTLDHGIYFGVGSSGNAKNGLVDNVVAYNHYGFGVQFWDADSAVIKNSTIYSNGSLIGGGGIALGTDLTNTQNFSVHDNLIYNNKHCGIYLRKYQSGSNMSIYNNTLYGNGSSHYGSGRDILDGGGSPEAQISINNNIFSVDNKSVE